MFDWIDDDGNLIGDVDFECWLSVSAFLHNNASKDADIFSRISDSQVLLLESAAKLCEEIGLYYRRG